MRRRLRAGSGIVLFRVPITDPTDTAAWLVRILESDRQWQGHFSVVTDRLTRQRPLPS